MFYAKKKINKYISLRFENGQTNIYILGKIFSTCKFLIMNLDPKLIEYYEKATSLDYITDHYRKIKGEPTNQKIKKKEAFWGHCSNFQAWVENDYNCDIMDRKLAFPILRILTSHDPKAKQTFKEEIIHKLKQGYENTFHFLINEGYLEIFTFEELEIIYNDVKKSMNLISTQTSEYNFIDYSIENRFDRYFNYRTDREHHIKRRERLLEVIAKRRQRIKKWLDSLVQTLIADFLDDFSDFYRKYRNKIWLKNQLKTHTVKDIAQKCNVSRSTIYNWKKML